jgi:3-oxoadipate enol-lactonase
MTSFVDIAHGRLAYEIQGDGPPLLLIRPLGGSMALWDPFRGLLAEHFRVIAFDLRGTGRSSGDPLIVTTRGIARDAVGLLDALAVSKAHVFGISLGGMAATWLAIDAPLRVDKLCIACAPPLGLELTNASLERELALAATFLRPRHEVEPALVTRVLSHPFRARHPERVREIERIVAQTPSSRLGLLRHALAGLMHDPGERIREISAPTLVLAGARDHLLGIEPPRELAAQISGAKFALIEDAGHDLTLEQPAQTAGALSAFLTRG